MLPKSDEDIVLSLWFSAISPGAAGGKTKSRGKHPEVLNSIIHIFFRRNYSSISENIPLISDHVPKHKKPVSDEEFASYLAGLIEGDGYISSNVPNIQISFHINDASLAYYIKKRIGYSHSLKCSSLNNNYRPLPGSPGFSFREPRRDWFPPGGRRVPRGTLRVEKKQITIMKKI